MHAYILLFILSSILALDPAHLKPGALTAHLGSVSLVEDVIWIRYPYTALSHIPSRLMEVTKELDAAMTELSTAQEANSTLFNLTSSRLMYMKASIKLILENYYCVDTSVGNYAKETHPFFPFQDRDNVTENYYNPCQEESDDERRTKRGLIDGIGHLSRMLFGTAMNADVQKLKERYNQLTSIASINKKVIDLNSENIARLEMLLKDLTSYATEMRSSINNLLEEDEDIHAVLIMNQALSILDSTLNSLLHTNRIVIQNLIDAGRGKVTSSLFPVKDLLRTLNIGKLDFNLIPLFDSHSIQYYYPLLESVLTSDAIVIHVPFQSRNTFEAHQIEPFPFETDDAILKLDLAPSVVLVAKDFSLYAVGDLSDLQKCRTEYRQLYHCPAYLFAFLPVTGEVCEVVLTQADASKALSLCPYTQLVPKPLFHQNFFGFNYFYFTKPVFVSIVCPNHTEYREVKGHLAVLIACYLRSTQLSTFPSKLHHGFTSNLSSLIIPMESLNNLNFSTIKYVTNTLREFKPSNNAALKTAMRETLPQLESPMHYVSLIIPTVLIIVFVIPLIYVAKKVWTLEHTGRLDTHL